MSFFVTVVIRNLTYVFFLCFVVNNLCLVDSGGRGRVPLGFVLLLFFILPGLIGRPGIRDKSGYGNLGLGFVPAIIFHRSLGLDLVCGGVGRPISLGDLLVGLLYIKTRS